VHSALIRVSDHWFKSLKVKKWKYFDAVVP
jgi:hypothetical protein